ncbi:hypothetical protein PGT21_020434 [Puccinia graminis f. sp. tritici]|uniref:Wax synthase domain-containing protein n=1 Tax=Puccinia graminis f. sp. tritici TaxID=56615 RepID=A0A5B0NCK8_PUCGR|nr:hypothetical protein PGT21_020434 [Puccinia graminis f. sp. tritici]KAA1112149.1 hypothetical protein PGTUg99_010275 [Puccinia graminis f. sp. tritici]
MESIPHHQATLFPLKGLTSAWLATNGTSSSPQSLSRDPTTGMIPGYISEKSVITSLMIVQCGLLHPKFEGSSSARLARLSLGPLIIGWWLPYPFRLPVLALQDRNIFPGIMAAIMSFKSIEWTFASGPYHLRSLKSVDGVPVWEINSPGQLSLEKSQSGWGDLILWSGLLFTSQRGLRWSWGPEAKGNTNSFAKSFMELLRLQLVFLASLAFVLYSEDWTNYSVDSRGALLSLGVPSFRGLGLLAGALHSVCTMLALSCTFEIPHTIATLLSYLVYPMTRTIGLPPQLAELVNPACFPPLFGSLFELSSLADFWGKSWHQKFRRHFLFCGGKPAKSLARVLGGSPKIQKACGLLGVFAVSGFLHEYPLYAFQREPHPYPRELFTTLPGSFLFFFIQPLGILLEPFVIPYVPKKLGGAKLWTASFLLLTAPLFTRDACRPPGMFNQFRPLEEWTWLEILLPGPLVARTFYAK